MKQILYFLFFTLLVASSLYAQTAADYYVPLHAGNTLIYHTVPPASHSSRAANGSGWAERTTIERVAETELVNTIPYSKYKTAEVLDNMLSDTLQRLVVWLRTDGPGNVVIGAFSPRGYDELDSAIVLGYGQPLFTGGFLHAGYSLTYPVENYFHVDSILSTTETVHCAAGTFTNCIKVSLRHLDSTGVIIFQEYEWYALGVGKVWDVRTIPDSEAHVDQLMSYNFVTGVGDARSSITPGAMQLLQNYPNPFNPTSVIRFTLPEQSHVRLTVSNVLGQEVQTLLNGVEQRGEKSVEFNAAGLPSGLYFYKLEASPVANPVKILSLTRKMLLVR